MAATQLLLVHGAWHGSWCWGHVRPALEGAGFAVKTVDLPSHGEDISTLGGLHDDAAVVREALAGLADPVVIVAHSYGGAAVSEGATDARNVSHLVYLAAFMIDQGESLLGAAGGTAPPLWEATPDGQAWCARTPERAFYNDCSQEDTAWAVPQLRPQSARSFAETLRAAAWHDRPSTYVVCECDQAIPVSAQETMSQHADDVIRLDAGHSPFLSRPEELVNLLRRFVRGG